MGISKFLSGIQENISLANHTTFKIGGPARYFFVAKNREDVISALKAAKESGIPYYIIGGGSNLLVSDKGFDGLVIKILNTQYIIHGTKIIADAGVNLGKLVFESINAGLTGLEWAMGIPGTIGGAIVGNAGAYGHSTSEAVKEVKTLNAEFKVSSYKFQDCGFVYRGSAFQQKNEIITEVGIELRKGDKEKSMKQLKDIILQRRTKVPPYPSAGSFFKNYRLESKDYNKDPLVKRFPDLIKKIRSNKIGVAYLIDQCGLKGKQIGGAKVAEEHANFIVNAGGATAKDVLGLADICKQKVKEKYGLELKPEKRFLGF
jgi:UDP-N-acetylmuramate dehydrogenase